ncbi:MAG: translocation/assembly module TamB [Flavobacteriaceae bacterium]|nr:translocation/assembly module TamB [Flavobacteriaceae bacterium]
MLVLLVIILSIPAVQTKIAKRVTESLNETYGTDIQIERLGLNWKGEVDIRNVFIRDHHKDTLIYTEILQTNILSIKKLIDGDLDFGFLELENTTLFVKTYKDEMDDNLTVFTDKFNTGDTTEVKPFQLLTNDVSLINAHIRVSDENEEVPVAVDFKNLNLDAEDFQINGPEITANINSLSFFESRGIEVKDASVDFKYTETEMFLKDLYLDTGASKIKGTGKLTFEDGMADFINKVILEFDFDKTTISSNDLNKIYPEFGEDLELQVDGNFSGILNDFKFTKADIRYGNSQFKGDFTFKNLFNEEIYMVKGTNHYIATNYFDLRRILPNLIGKDLPVELKKLGNFSLSGDSEIKGDELKTNSAINTAIGKANANIELGNITDFKNAYYKGTAQLTRFNIGKIAETTSLGEMNADLTFNGRGFTAATISTLIQGSIDSFEFENYTYQNITVEGNLKNPKFNGKLNINDPNLKMNFDGLIDISEKFNQYDFEADIEYAELNKLNLFTRDSVSVFAGKIIMDMDGTTINDAVGTIQFSETFYQTQTKDFFFDDFTVTSTFNDEERTIEINSPDIISGKIQGKFLVEDIPYLFRNSIGSIYTNYIPQQVTPGQYINYEFNVYNKIVDVFVPQLQLGENTRIKGSVFSDESKFKLDFKSPELLLYKNYFGKVNVKLDNDNPLFNAYISVDSLYTGSYNLVDLNIINKTLNDTLYIQSQFAGGKDQSDLFNLSLYHTINEDGNSVVGIKRSKINYKGNDWFLNKENNNLNKITFDDNFRDIKLDSLTLRHNDELIQLAGFKKDSSVTDMKLQFTNVDLGKIAPEIDSLNLKGRINGHLDFVKRRGAFYPDAEVVIEDVNFNTIDLGDLELNIKGNTNLTQYTIHSSLINDNVSSFKAEGTLDVGEDQSLIDLDVSLSDFNLKAFSPFGGDVITNLRGLASGKAKVNGNYKSPDITGRIDLVETGLKIPYLNVDFNIEDDTSVFLTKDMFRISPTFLTDTKYGTVAEFEGNVTHSNFSKWALDFDLETIRLLVLDTPKDEDALYYGTAFISGTSKIAGPIDELVIDVVATTEAGTKFKIPISDAASIGDDSFIRFISPEEKKARLAGETFVSEEIKGLSLNFELDINENAEVEVLVDQVNNSNLRGRGAGILLLEINTLGKFKMWGDFLIIDGKYDFRYAGLVDKTIDVVPGGNITWDGEPTKARLDLTAKYTVSNVNPSALLDNPSLNSTVNVDVLLNLTGEIMQPDLDFQLSFPGVSSAVREELEDKIRDKEQRQTQAIFLASTGSFQSDAAAGQNAIAGTLTERVNKLVADIFAGNDSKFKVLPTLSTRQTSLNEQIEYQVNVQLSTKISERILVNGKVAVPVGGANESSVAGDIEVQWLVNDDGSLRINFFNRQADLQFIGEDQIFEQGAGVSYSVDFDTFSELMKKLFNKKLTIETENEVPIIPEDNNTDHFENQGIKPDDQEMP